jgi:hypothetical protein
VGRNLPSQARPSASQQGPHFQRTGAVPRLWRVTRLVEIDAAAAGCPQQDSPAWSSLAALQTAWPGCSVDHRNRTLYRAACSWWPSVTESSIEFANERSRSPPSGAAGRRLSTAAASVVRPMKVRGTDGVVAARCQRCCARYVSRSENAHLLCTPDGGSIELGRPRPRSCLRACRHGTGGASCAA